MSLELPPLPIESRVTPAETRLDQTVTATGDSSWVVVQGAPRRMLTSTPEIEHVFTALKDRWLRETKFISSDTDIVLHESYQQIMALGPAALPLVFREVQAGGGLWFWALKSITRDDPVSPEDIGVVPRMAAAWLRWGAERGYV